MKYSNSNNYAHEEFVKKIITNKDKNGFVKSRERQDLEYKASFGLNSAAKYAKTMASFANNKGGYIIFGVTDVPRIAQGVNNGFKDFKQEKFTEHLNSLFSPEIEWESGIVDIEGTDFGYIYTHEALEKPIVALKNETSEKINSGDILYRYRGSSQKIKYPEMNKIISDRIKQEREQILRLMEVIRKSDTANLGIVNYNNGRFSTPYGTDIMVDKKLVVQVLRKAKYIKQGSFNETEGIPVLKVTGNIDLAEEVPVPDIEPDVQYPYIQKELGEKLNLSLYDIGILINYYEMKGKKKYHLEIRTSKMTTTNKYSDIALQFLAEKINENKDNVNWLKEIKEEAKNRNQK